MSARSLVVATFALGLAASVARADPSIEASLSPEVIAPGDEATYTLTITGAAGGQVTTPRFGDLVAGDPQHSMQSAITISNGRQTIQTSEVYVWNVQAPRAGKFVIGAATLVHNGETLRSNEVTLTCDPNAPAPQASAPTTQGLGGRPWDPFAGFDDDFPDPFNRPRRAASGDEVFLRATVDKTDAYLGEQVTLSLYLYAEADVAGVQSVSFPKLDGFWAEDIAAPTQLTPELKTIHGTTYRAYLLRRRALFPLKAGTLTIDPVEAQVNLGLSMFFGAPQDTVKRRSAAVTLNVKPLPADGQPPNFPATNVGELSLSAEATPPQVALGNPVQLKVTLEGTGNLKSVEVPKPALPAGLKTYDPTVTDKSHVSGMRWGGTKTLEWVVIPERTGRFTIPPLELPYFSPAKQQYEVARTSPIDLAVTAANGAPAPMASAGVPAAPGVSNLLTDSIRPARLDAVLASGLELPVWHRGWFWPVTAAPVALWGLLWIGGALGGALRGRDPEKLKTRRARGQAAKRLAAARSLLDRHDARGFHAELQRALVQFVTDKVGVPALGLTRDQLDRALADRGVAEQERHGLRRIVDACEIARFAPAAATDAELSRLLDDASNLIDRLDDFQPGRRS